MRIIRSLFVSVLTFTLPWVGAGAQDTDSTTVSTADSLRVAARAAQVQFEALRIRELPTTFFLSGAGCDEEIGRFCYWDEEDEEWDPGPEKPAVTGARDSLISLLQQAYRENPTDRWLMGQLIRYQLESNPDAALGTLQGCATERWWCLALTGLVESRLADTEVATNTFTEMLAEIPRGPRCEWRNISHLLRDDLLDFYRGMTCARRDTVENVFWWLADPFYMQPGNDRWVEHFARRVRNELVKNSASTYGSEWRLDVEELLIRFGWPIGWERSRGIPGQESITSHHEPTAQTFVPPSAALLEDIGEVSEERWPTEVRLGPSRHIPPYTRRMISLPHQAGIFRRGDSLLAVAAYELPDTLAEVPTHAALITATGGPDSEHITYRPVAGLRGDFITMSEAKSMVMSLEVLATDSTFGARARYGIKPPSLNSAGIGASDIIVFGVREDRVPINLDEARFMMLGDLDIAADSEIGLYWELYGITSASDSVATEISIQRTDRSLLRGLFQAIGLAGRVGPAVTLEWENAAGQTTRVFPRSVIVDLNDIDPGNYVITLTVDSETGESTVVERRITIVEPD